MKDDKNYNGNYDADFSELVGKTIIKMEGGEGSETITFAADCGVTYKLHYYGDCCATCSVEEIHGDVNDLLNTPILFAEEVSSKEPSIELKAERDAQEDKRKAEQGNNYYPDGPESETWTFYKLSTIKGSVTIRWYGSSNGYYSETATFERLG